MHLTVFMRKASGAGRWGLIAGTYGHRWGQHFNGRTEWGFVFLTLKSGGMNILNILKRASIKDLLLNRRQRHRRLAPGPSTGLREAVRVHSIPPFFCFCFCDLLMCTHTHISSLPPPSPLLPCPLLCLIRLSGC